GTGRATNEVAPAVLAAKDGNVFKLFVAVNTQIWGKFDPEKRTVSIHNVPEPGDEDLLELATAHTLLTRGAVYAVAAEKVPGAPPIAAVLRYPGPVATS
ncbi:MAG: hypothetical protein HYX95_01160, partial [Chloroflexi bacterium]|nr:hypothetical protein [Chloroflexota bacterium]